MMSKFCVFILTHKRPDNVKTVKMLRRSNYTGDIFLVVDDEDPTVEEYREKHGKSVVVFSKGEAEAITDTIDNEPVHRGVVYARNWVWNIAREKGYDYFLVLDDDYTDIYYKHPSEKKGGGMELRQIPCRQLDQLFEAMVQFLIVSGAKTVAFAQSGDFLGGLAGSFRWQGIARKAMNSFFCATDRQFSFVGRINEDVNMYLLEGIRGGLIMTITRMGVQQLQTQKATGGLTEIYLDTGTYVKSFYSVIVAPSCVKVGELGETHKRVHHRVAWNNAVPKILNERLKKG